VTRREFSFSALATAACSAPFIRSLSAADTTFTAGMKWPGWKKGHFQIHTIHTGVGESQFLIFPDSTTMLIDCGDFDTSVNSTRLNPMPDSSRKAGEWIARYVLRTNPNKDVVDYMHTSHYHRDHTGSMREGWAPSGWALAMKFLHFNRAVDRAWPTFDDPVRPSDTPDHIIDLLKYVYSELARRDGTVIERFRLGATDQFVPMRNSSMASDFSVRNICANGRIAYPDGTVRDLLRRNGKFSVSTANWLENEMSCGSVFSYGPFRYFTAGDFSCRVDFEGGVAYYPEVDLGRASSPVNVAKMNHHACYAMPPEIVRDLRAQVWTGCVWNTVHLSDDAMNNLADRNLYPGKRVICPGMVAEKVRSKAKAAGRAWINDVPESVFSGAHVVVDVPPGGETYSVSFIDARDESMHINEVMHFRTADRA
jgi:hypothetical protein